LATKLQLFNQALILCGERTIASLSEDRESRRLLDEVYDSGGISRCLEMGQWNFAMRTVQIDSDPDIEPEFGYSKAFSKPTDWVSLSALCSDSYFKSPLTDFVDESDYWYADTDPIYVRYVSNDEEYGGDIGLWTQTFFDYVCAHFARKIVLKLTGDKERVDIVKKAEKEALLSARNKDAQGDPTLFPPPGKWTTSRSGRGGRDGGNRGSLTG
jgi:hypothetical protein